MPHSEGAPHQHRLLQLTSARPCRWPERPSRTWSCGCCERRAPPPRPRGSSRTSAPPPKRILSSEAARCCECEVTMLSCVARAEWRLSPCVPATTITGSWCRALANHRGALWSRDRMPCCDWSPGRHHRQLHPLQQQVQVGQLGLRLHLHQL